ncbi:hypothetical protein SAMN05444170_6614 [Bradyrhizobium erythrophlei]|uniref:Uncharacterized protein n=1 Tax=Bradyrhizobium erythrophlei TaxID=1437360 RepID=A0A1M7UT93_9BRAD|nr:hypothetical protein SAMN05444170_6614 [Bradyrhizobium erythrophlei]
MNFFRFGLSSDMPNDPDQYDEKEAKKRFEAALRAGLKTPHKPLKEKPKISQKKKMERDRAKRDDR